MVCSLVCILSGDVFDDGNPEIVFSRQMYNVTKIDSSMLVEKICIPHFCGITSVHMILEHYSRYTSRKVHTLMYCKTVQL